MSKFITILLLLTTIGGFAQDCNPPTCSFAMLSIDNSELQNCKDSMGQKQGWWILYDTANIYFPLKIGDFKSNSFYRGEYAIGQYKNDTKIGIWKSFYSDGCVSEINQTVVFEEDGSVLIKDFPNNETRYNPDSSIVRSRVRIPNNETVNIECLNRTCQGYYKGSTCTESFPVSLLPFYQQRLISGEYSMQIKRLKAQLKD